MSTMLEFLIAKLTSQAFFGRAFFGRSFVAGGVDKFLADAEQADDITIMALGVGGYTEDIQTTLPPGYSRLQDKTLH